ncbi:zinc transporter ZIP10-like [Leptodactylus fuscus]|uniref:zinc transporter ZIP10-like n=1 Tax=Leptodactylus fuscus TaxID=238119 RepID=UPI003F4EC18E
MSEDPYLDSEASEPSIDKSSLPEAEHEQKYFIEKLFHRYGENGRLPYYGLERLLSSLGLGEVKVVEIGHEDIGHDPVSHLDVLDVQEGKHLHVLDDTESHTHTNEKNESEIISTKEFNKCNDEKASAALKHKTTPNSHLHHPAADSISHSHNSMDHNHSATTSNASLKGQTSGPLTDTNTSQEQVEKKLHRHKKRRKGTKRGEATKDLHVAQDDNQHGNKPDLHPAATLIPANVDEGNLKSEEHRQESEYHRGNIRKREAPNDKTSIKIHAGFEKDQRQHDNKVHEHDECLNVTQLLSYYGLNINSPISPKQFAYLCPALLYQIDSRFCIKHFAHLEVETLEASTGPASAWVCGLISVTVISLLSLLGVILIPVIDQGCFKFLLNFLVALAVGTLSGDALLHLLPHSQMGHDHESKESRHDHGDEFLKANDSVMKGLVALGGLYLLFVIEHCLQMFKQYKDRQGRQSSWKQKQKADESGVGKELKPLPVTDNPIPAEFQHLEEAERSYEKVFVAVEDAMPHIIKNESCDGDHSVADGQFDHNHAEITKTSSKHSHHSHGHYHLEKDMKNTGIASIAWMVIMGDGMHNFSDGLAIGAAFSAGLTGGISTSVAVFCHELPHELGDFAVLLKAGMTVKQAIVYNLLSAMLAYVGMLIGTAVGQYTNNITLWIFAVTAGMFLYVALVDMLPEMLRGDDDNEENGSCPLRQFILQNLGLLLGFAIMLVIALYEEQIVFDIQL